MKKQWLIFLSVFLISPVIFSNSIDSSKIPVSVTYSPDGLTFSSSNGDFSTTLSGFIQADAMKFDQNNQGLSSGTNIRRARLYLGGNLTPDWGYLFAYDFRPENLLFAEVDYLGWKNMQLSFGQIFPNFSLNNSSSLTSLQTLESPLPVNAFCPPFSVGVGYNAWNDFLVLQLAGFGPGTSEDVTGRNPLGGTVRVVYSPIHTETKVLDFGLSGWIQRPDGSNSLTVSTVPEIQSVKVNTGSISDVDNYGVIGAEIGTVFGPWSIQTEYLQMRVNRGDNKQNLKFSGYYLTASYFLTGESLAYAFPAADFEGDINIHNKKLGAWEVVGRYSAIDLNDSDVIGGKEHNALLGLNWYINPHAKVLLNYIYSKANPGSNGSYDRVNSVGARLQFTF